MYCLVAMEGYVLRQWNEKEKKRRKGKEEIFLVVCVPQASEQRASPDQIRDKKVLESVNCQKMGGSTLVHTGCDA